MALDPVGKLFSNLPGGSNTSKNRLGKKQNFLQKDQKQGTVGELVDSQEFTNQILTTISQQIDSLGGDSSGLFGSGNGSNGDNGGNGFSDAIQEKFMGKISDKFSNNPMMKGLMEKMGASNTSLGNMSQGMKGMEGKAGGAMIALQIINKMLEIMRGILSTINDTVQKGIDQSITNQKQYLGPISARLQSFSSDSISWYKELSFNIRDVFTNSRYINQQEMLKNLNSLVEAGIGYNLEDRAYLMTIADRTVKTFDLLDPSLNRIIRLQQADLSRAQMGLEAFLTQGLNEVFQDTSYLNSMYDSVTAALVDATSQMSYEETTGYLYNVQKWLASLYSVGMSENAITQIAQGLNLLGTGNVSQLTGNDQLNTLFAMSAQRAGLSYAQLLTTGVSEDNVDKLLRSMIEYLQSIAENTSSEVLRNEYGRVFGGLSVADFRAVQNLTADDIKYIDAYKLSMEDATKELAEQTAKLKERTSVAEQVENMFNNLIYSIGAQVGESEKAYTKWVYSNIAEELGDAVGGVLPGIVGDIFKNATGVATEAIKTGTIFDALRGKVEDQNGKGLSMFDSMVVDKAEEVNEGIEGFFDNDIYGNIFGTRSDLGTTLADIFSGFGIIKLISRAATRSAMIGAMAQNWDVYSQKGLGELPFINWQQGTSRINEYSSSIALEENEFEKAQTKIEAASQEITGVDDSVTQSIDDLYDGLFGNEARPIKVMLVDIDGNILASTNTNQFSSNFDLEESVGASIFGQARYAKGIE